MKSITIDTGFSISANTSFKDAMTRVLFSSTKAVAYRDHDGQPAGFLTKPMLERANADNIRGFMKGVINEVNDQIEDDDYIVVPLCDACPNLADLVPSDSLYGTLCTELNDRYVVYDKPIIFINNKEEIVGITILNKED